MDSGEIKRPKNWLESLNYAIEGVIYAFKTQRHVRYHYVIAAAALFLSFFLELPVVEFVLFAMSVIILLFAEMMNTAIEETVNLVEDKYHMMAKNAKDVSAGAVLIASIGVAIMAYMIFSKYIYADGLRAARGKGLLRPHSGSRAPFRPHIGRHPQGLLRKGQASARTACRADTLLSPFRLRPA